MIRSLLPDLLQLSENLSRLVDCKRLKFPTFSQELKPLFSKFEGEVFQRSPFDIRDRQIIEAFGRHVE